MISLIYRDICLFFRKNYKVLLLCAFIVVVKALFNYNEFKMAIENSLIYEDIFNEAVFLPTFNMYFERMLATTFNVDGIIEYMYIILIFGLYIYIAIYIYFSDICLAPEQIFLRISKKKYIIQKFITILIVTILISIVFYCIVAFILFLLGEIYINFDLLMVNLMYKIMLQFLVIAIFGLIGIFTYLVVFLLITVVLQFKIESLYFLFPTGCNLDANMFFLISVIILLSYYICRNRLIGMFRKEKLYGI